MFHDLAVQLWDWVKSFPPHAGVAILSAAPISEFRIGVFYGLTVGKLSLWETLPISIVACMAPAIPIFLGFNWVTRNLADKPLLGRFVQKLLTHAKHKSERVSKWGALGLAIFSGVPLPGFGVYTASAIAAVMAVPFRRAVLAMLAGVTAGAILVAALTLGGVQMFDALVNAAPK
jgi:uncharacterized membrane protein